MDETIMSETITAKRKVNRLSIPSIFATTTSEKKASSRPPPSSEKKTGRSFASSMKASSLDNVNESSLTPLHHPEAQPKEVQPTPQPSPAKSELMNTTSHFDTPLNIDMLATTEQFATTRHFDESTMDDDEEEEDNVGELPTTVAESPRVKAQQTLRPV
jgi:hypothetical protein